MNDRHQRALGQEKSAGEGKIPWWFGAFPFAIAFDNRLLSVDKAVLLQILAYAGEKGWCDASNRTLARYITASLNSRKNAERANHKSVSDKTIAASLERLEHLEYIQREESPWTERNATGRIIRVTFSEEAMLTRFPKGVPVPKKFREKAAKYGGLKHEGCELKIAGGTNSDSPPPPNLDSQVGTNSDSHKGDAHTRDAQIREVVEKPAPPSPQPRPDCGPQGTAQRRWTAGLEQRAKIVEGKLYIAGRSHDDAARAFKLVGILGEDWSDANKVDVGNLFGMVGLDVIIAAVEETVRCCKKPKSKRPKGSLVNYMAVIALRIYRQHGETPPKRLTGQEMDALLKEQMAEGNSRPIDYFARDDDEERLRPPPPRQEVARRLPSWMQEWHIAELEARYPDDAHKLYPIPDELDVDEAGVIIDLRGNVVADLGWAKRAAG